jgi:kynurenine formamidase
MNEICSLGIIGRVSDESEQMTTEEFDQLFDELKTWGRWTGSNVPGTLNYLTPARTAAAASQVRTGRTVTMSLPVNTLISADNPRPAVHSMSRLHPTEPGPNTVGFATDFLGMDFHGNAHTHMDALCHVSYRGSLYDGIPAETVTRSGGTTGTVDDYRNGLAGRGVLLDLPRLRGVRWLEPGEAVTAAELEAAEQAHGVRLGEGDIFVFRTGEHRRRLELGPWDMNKERAGLHPTAIRLLADRNVAVFAPDGDGEVAPGPVKGVSAPIHCLQVVAMGMAVMDSLQLEDLAAACAEEERWEFLFVTAPLRIANGTGSPTNPIAIF